MGFFFRAFEAAAGAAILAGAIALLTVAAPVVAMEAVEGVAAAYGSQAMGGVMTGMFAMHAGSTMIVDATTHGIKRRKLNNSTDPFESPQGSDTEEDSDMDEDDTAPGYDDHCVILPETQDIVDSYSGPGPKTRSRTTNPLVTPDRHGDFAGIQKTMLNPVTGKIIGLKMQVRTRRSRFGGHAFTALKRAARAHHRGDHVRGIKVTQTTPISVLNAPFSP